MNKNEKYSFKFILKECLQKHNLSEIKNNEVILSYITSMLNYTCDDVGCTLLRYRDSTEKYEYCKSQYINEVEEEFNKCFKVYKTDEKIVIESTYFERYKREFLNNDMANTLNKKILKTASSILRNQFSAFSGRFEINTYKLRYDRKTFKTFWLKIEREYEVSGVAKNVLGVYSETTLEEYNKKYEMISSKKYAFGSAYSIHDISTNSIKYSDEYNNTKKQEFITGGDMTQCNFKYLFYEYSFIFPTSRDAQVTDYVNYDRSSISLEDLEDELELIADCQELHDEKPVIGITYVYSEDFLENVEEMKHIYEENIGKKLVGEAKRKGLTLEEYLNK